MISLECPICSAELNAVDGSEMERLFEDHLRIVHAVRDFCNLDSHDRIEGSIQSCQQEVVEEAKGIPREVHNRPVFEYSMRDQMEHMPQSLPLRDVPDSEMVEIRCPICGARVEGTDDRDLSYQLRLHFSNDHMILMDVAREKLRER